MDRIWAFVPDLAGLRPGYWINEISGVLRPAVEAYLAGEPMTAAQIAVMRAYLRQWIMSPVWDQNPHHDDGPLGSRFMLAELRAGIEGLISRAAIESWLAAAVDEGIDPL